MKLNKSLMLPAILWAKPAAAEDENHRIGALQLRELPAFRGVIGELVIGEDSAWNNVRSHRESPFYFSFFSATSAYLCNLCVNMFRDYSYAEITEIRRGRREHFKSRQDY